VTLLFLFTVCVSVYVVVVIIFAFLFYSLLLSSYTFYELHMYVEPVIFKTRSFKCSFC